MSRLDVPQRPPLPAGGALPGQCVDNQFSQYHHEVKPEAHGPDPAHALDRIWPGDLDFDVPEVEPGQLTGVFVVGQVYFSSLPLGIYLLMIGQLWLGVALVSLVPSTLLLLVLYGFCQCLCHELMEALAARAHSLP